MGLPCLPDFTKHRLGCDPINPCGSCAAVSLARRLLSPEDFDEFIRLAKGGNPYPNLTPTNLNQTLSQAGFHKSFVKKAQVYEVINLGQLACKSPAQILSWYGMGDRSLRTVIKILKLHELELGLRHLVEKSEWVRPA